MTSHLNLDGRIGVAYNEINNAYQNKYFENAFFVRGWTLEPFAEVKELFF